MDFKIGGKNEAILYGVGAVIVIILAVYLFKQAKEAVLDVKDVLTGGDHEAEASAQKSREKIVDNLVINKARLKYTPQSYDNSANKLHAGLTTIGRFEAINLDWIKPIIQTYAIKKDDWNMLRKSFGIRDGKDMFQYITEKSASTKVPFSKMATVEDIDDLIKALNKKHGTKNAKDNAQLIG